MSGPEDAAPAPAPPGLPAARGSSFEAYLAEVSRITPLSREEEQRLARQLRDGQDLAAARALIMANLRHVVTIARGYLGYGLPLGDLVQEGNIGLMKAVRRFDPAAGVRLISFAVHWIRAEIHEYVLRNWSIVRMATTKAQRKLFFRLRGLKRDTGALTASDAARIARTLAVPVGEVRRMDARLQGDRSLDAPVAEDGGADRAPGWIERLQAEADTEQACIDVDSARRRREALRRALPRLDARSRDIIERRWLAPGKPAHLIELARDHGISIERVRQIQNQALRTLRHDMAARAPGAEEGP